MAKPNLEIDVEPSEGGSVVYLLLAPRKQGAPADAQLSLRLTIENKEPSPVHANLVHLAFANPQAPFETIPVDLDIAAGATKAWNFSTADNVLLSSPAPQEMTVGIFCDGFDQPTQVTRPLSHHTSPVPGGSYRFPAENDDLGPGEYWHGRSAAHGPAGGGVQLFGYDLGVVAKDPSTGSWSALHPGGDFGNNEDYRIWGKPICAMADGTVVAFANDQPTNPDPPDDLSPPGAVEGNHFYIQHGDELMLYAHFQEGSLASDLLSVGAQVKAGDFLGLAGNSGNSTAPHLHIHAIKATSPWKGPLRPIPLHGISVLDRTETPVTGPSSKWVDVLHRGLPSVESLIYPHDKRSRLEWLEREWLAVDPLSLVLSQSIYVKLTLPDPAPIEVLAERIRSMVSEMTPEERRRALADAEKLGQYARVLQKELERSL